MGQVSCLISVFRPKRGNGTLNKRLRQTVPNTYHNLCCASLTTSSFVFVYTPRTEDGNKDVSRVRAEIRYGEPLSLGQQRLGGIMVGLFSVKGVFDE